MKQKQSSKPKKIVIMAALAVALGAAVWLNMNYSAASGGFVKSKTASSQVKNLGDTEYVNNTTEKKATETSAAGADYFTKAKADREKTRNEAIALLKETANDAKATAEAKAEAAKKAAAIADNMDKEAAIETVIKAKGFEQAVAVIGEKGITVMVQSGELTQSQTLQIQDAVTANSSITVENIKIVNIK